MEIGNQIKAFRLRKGVTQEAMAGHLGVSAQAVSKWERGAAAPDIALLPALSAYLGVTIDELFSLSDATRMERIQNMLWDTRVLDAAQADAAREFLLDKARREPEDGEALALLSDMENHIALTHRALAADYARQALRRDHKLGLAWAALREAMDGAGDWCVEAHSAFIDFCKELIARHPEDAKGYWWLLDNLIADNRLAEARDYCEKLSTIDQSYNPALYRGRIALRAGEADAAAAIFRKMEADFPKDWRVAFEMGNVMARAGEYEKAKSYFRQATDLQAAPRYTDGLTSISLICEIEGDIPGAIAAAEEEISVLATEWATTTGESVEQHRRRIAALREKAGQG